MSTKLVLTDIDGTILPYGDKVVGERTRAAFHAAAEAGIVMGPASGRFYSWIPEFFDNDPVCYSTAIASNGLQVAHGGEIVRATLIDSAALTRVQDVLRGVPGSGLIFFEDSIPYLFCGDRADLACAFPRYGRVCLDARNLPDEGVQKANVFVNSTIEDTCDLVSLLAKEVGELDFDVPQPMFANIMPAGWNKGSALMWLCDYLGVGTNEVVVFGDAGNDLALFEVVADSVAVADAAPEATAAARWHIGPCADQSVAAAVIALVAGDWPFSA